MKEQIIKAIINSLGFLEDTEGHGYKLHIYKDEWWISHNIVGSGEPVKDWLEREFNKLDKIDKRGGWICPRCQKVHSWLSMTCDCEPKTITSITY